MISTDDQNAIKEYVNAYLNERMNSGKDYYLNQRDKTDLIEKLYQVREELAKGAKEDKKNIMNRIDRQTTITGIIIGITATLMTILSHFK